MSSILSIIQIALTLVPLLLCTRATAAATQSASTPSPTISTSTSSSSASGSQATGSSSVLHPTQGETIVYGSQYTIQWTPPAIPGSISIELWDDDEWSWASTFNTGDYNITEPGSLVGCDGWIVNSQCGKIARSVPNNGSYVWNISSPIIGYQTLSGKFTYHMAIYIQQSDYFALPSKNSSWHVRSGTFILAPTSSSSTSSSASSSGSNTFLPSTTLRSSSATRVGSGPTATSSAGAGARTAMDQLGWGVLGLIGVLAIW
ncbi:uncharacterized protein K444DRAFT_616628 [Hyaloscypha bicolor E]|uniref:Lytic polysaccharide monooxygenase n=1 Tax=Hyaloscypha bicolor E TaxID=1095630 RepID=A0A2J6SXT2_9HELO|nr:uncharacterized protein K444DRAFT_616628 [Hyaloscypha bicolor E]PMD55588.1 hypothetical protein K444DRAFT_616628 [Hyaloscypha bicolor E]